MNAPPPPSRVPRGVRNCGDIWEYRAVPIVDVWRALLDRLPPEAPGLFNRGLRDRRHAAAATVVMGAAGRRSTLPPLPRNAGEGAPSGRFVPTWGAHAAR